MSIRIFFVVVFLFFPLFVLTPTSAFAAFNYTPLEELPGAADARSFPDYIQGIYKFGMWTVGLAALFMITIGGFLYLSSAGNTSAMGSAKRYIWDAIIGLVLAILAWIVLNVINPDLVNVNLDTFSKVGGTVPPASQSESGGYGRPKAGGTCTTTPSEATTITASMKAKAASILEKVTINSSGDCRGAGGVVISPEYNFQQIADGHLMTKCFDGCRDTNKCGGSYCSATTFMSEAAMDTIIKTQDATENVIGINRFRITSVAGGDHAQNSDHYHGKAIDVVLTTNNIGWGPTLQAFINNGAVADNGDRSGSFCEASNGSYINCLGKNTSKQKSEAGTHHLHVRLP